MNFSDIPVEPFSIRVRFLEQPNEEFLKRIQQNPEPIINIRAGYRLGEFELALNSGYFRIQPVAKVDVKRLIMELADGRSFLAQAYNPAADLSFEIAFAFFSGKLLDMGDLDIGIDEYVYQRIKKLRLTGKPENVFPEMCEFSQGDDSYFFIVAGPASKKYLEERDRTEELADNASKESPDSADEKSEDDNQDSDDENDLETQESSGSDFSVQPLLEPDIMNSFCICGNGIRFVVTEKRKDNNESIFIVTKLTQLRLKKDKALRLIKGKLKFVEWTKAESIRVLVKGQLDNLISDKSSYLKKWDEFGAREGEILLRNARDFGVVQYTRIPSVQKDETTVQIVNASASSLGLLSSGDIKEVEFLDGQLPIYLQNVNLTFDDFSKGVFERKYGRGNSSNTFKVVKYERNDKILTIKSEHLPDSGSFIYPMSGEISQIVRRMRARQSILEGRSANPQLGILIEENGQIEPTRFPQKIKALSSFVRNKVFKNPPTVKQEEAIKMALNTPDIALIQGPPGTGKTTVIAAIIERLNETSEKQNRDKGRILLTGFQHDAVENMIEKIHINSLPVPKFGKRSDISSEEEVSNFELLLEEWRQEVAQKLREKNPQIAEYEEERRIKNMCLQYLEVPSRDHAINLLNAILDLDYSVLNDEIRFKTQSLYASLTRQTKLNTVDEPLLPYIYALRTRPESFADDGADRASDVLDNLRERLSEGELLQFKDDIDLLEKASSWLDSQTQPPFLSQLHNLKRRLLVMFSSPPFFHVEKHNQELVKLVDEILSCMQKARRSVTDKKNLALADFLSELENDPVGMIDAVSDYSYAFAATCQQSKGEDISHQKKDGEYDYVIVDEAARVSPRDLMIAMSQGKRIILVGDHRQLPHIINEDVVKEMNSVKVEDAENDWLKKSMFEYLFSERLKALEEQDPDHPRRVTLDKQYRMHPLLGTFISQNFYERFNPDERFGSGLDESYFVHNLPGTDNKPAMWIDVPATRGSGCERFNTSWRRQVEAAAIYQKVKSWVESEEGKDLSYGVISFYKEQVLLIKSQFESLGLDEKRLRIGTVDSFQGMEFDVVFLSMVRTLTDIPEDISQLDDKERNIWSRRLFGHLCLYNRLNVAMSRQKRLLVVVGDSTLLDNELAKEFIPGLVNFYELCNNEGVVIE